MIINFYDRPTSSIFYTAATLYKHIKINGFDFDEAYSYFLEHINENPTLFYYSVDWLFLLGRIKDDGNGGFICD